MSARDKAYDAVLNASFEMRDGDGASEVVYPAVAADAASDVWEPIVRRLIEGMEDIHEALGDQSGKLRDVVRLKIDRAKGEWLK